MRRSTSAQSIMADKQQQQQQQQQLALTVSTSTLSITSIADYAEQANSPGTSSGKEHNWRKLSKGYALRTVLALQAGRKAPVAAASASLLLLCLLALVLLTRHGFPAQGSSPPSPRYAVYLDGGSSGTRVHVFQYTLAPWPQYARLVLPELSQAAEPGLSHFADQPEAAGTSLHKLLEFAHQQVPRQLWSSTPVRLMATAGLRLVTEQQRQGILDSCAAVLQSSHFRFQRAWASVIEGDMEGVYAWIGANYASGALQALQQTQPGGQNRSSSHSQDHHQRHQHQHQHQASRRSLELDDPGADSFGDSPPATGGGGSDSSSSSGSSRTPRSGGSGSGADEYMSGGKGGGAAAAAPSGGGLHGVMELGGASFQVTFLPASSGAPHDLSQAAVRRPEFKQQLFTHSYLGLGMDAAMARSTDLLKQQVPQQLQHRPDAGRQQEPGQGPVEDPCLPIGYSAADGRVGGSSFDGCLQLALAVVPLNPGCNTARALLNASSSGSSSGGGGGSGGGSGSNLFPPHQHQISDDGSRPTGLFESSQAVEGASAGEGRFRSGGREVLGAKVRGSRPVEEGLGGQDSALGGGVDNAGPSGAGSGRRRRGGIGGVSGGADGAEAGGGGGQGSRCSMDGVDVPPLSGRFLAVENLYWTAKALGLGQTASLQELRDAGQRYCAQHWTSLQAQYSGHVPDQYITRYCFGAAYVFVLLHLGLGIGLDERRLAFTNTLPGRDGGQETALSWVTGAAVLDAMDEEQQAGDATGAVPLGVLRGSRRLLLPLPLLVLLGVLLMAAAAVFAAAAAAALAVPPRWLRGWWQGPSHGQGGQSPLGATAAQGPDAGPLLGSYWRVGVESVGSRGSATASLPAPMHPGVGAGLGQGALLSALSRGSAPPRVSRLGQVLGSGMGLMARPSSLTSIDVQD